MRRTLGSFILLGILLTSCRQEIKRTPTINGLWESVGSGWLLQITDSTEYTLYDLTESSCLPNRKGPVEDILESLNFEGDSLFLLKGVITYAFVRSEEFPERCQISLTEIQKNDPLLNFDVFAETVDAHYAFMELNQIHWEALYAEQRGKLSQESSDVELYKVIEETLELLNDNHAYLEATDAVYEALESEALEAAALEAEALEASQGSEIDTTYEQESKDEALREYGDFEVAQMVATHHLKEEMTQDSWLIQWGMLQEGIGFIEVKSMWLYADLDIEKDLIDEMGYVDAYVQTFHQMYEGEYIEKEVRGVRNIMDRVMKDLSVMESIVIDVRFNGGGQDAVSFEILSRFLPERTLIATQKLKEGDGFTPILPLYIEGTSSAFTQPVYVLTSPQTGSAAEAFSIATLVPGHIQRIGSATSGAMSTALEKKLPNGWSFSISNEVYMDTTGKSYENVGIPVDLELGYPRERQPFFRSIAEDLESDRRNILHAIEALRTKRKGRKMGDFEKSLD